MCISEFITSGLIVFLWFKDYGYETQNIKVPCYRHKKAPECFYKNMVWVSNIFLTYAVIYALFSIGIILYRFDEIIKEKSLYLLDVT